MGKKNQGRELDEISKVFLSGNEGTKEKRMTGRFSSLDLNKADYSHQAEDACEIEETVNVRKRIAYQEDDNVQQNMQRALSRHLEEGFSIRRVELKKNEDLSEPRSRLRREEEVTIFIKPPASV